MIVVIDGIGNNLASVKFALQRIGAEAIFTDDVSTIMSATKVILPGVGTAKSAMAKLIESDLVDVIKQLTVPVLGVCVGMQVLFNESEEDNTQCLGVIDGVVRKLNALITPHMGWNKIDIIKRNKLIDQCGYCYFVHSFAVDVNDYTIATCSYQETFSAAVRKDNFYGVQFHPEKSADVGEQVLINFLEM